MSSIKVRLVFSVEVDGDVWGETYGNGAWPSSIREDVREYVYQCVAESAAANEGAIISVEARRT